MVVGVDKPGALAEYVKSNQERFYRLAYSYVHDRDAALDVVQDTIVHAFTHIHSLREPAYMQTWFYRILVNECLRDLRRRKRVCPLDDCPETGREDPDRAQALDLYRAVAALDPKLRTVVVLRFYEDMKLADIADITGATLSTVKNRLYKALALLREQLRDVPVDGL